MTLFLRAFATLAAALLLSACCHCVPPNNNLIVVLPAADGHIGGVVVESGHDKLVLDKAYAGAKPGGGAAQALNVDEREVQSIFSNALSARPIPPKTYTLYFENGNDALVPESQATLQTMLTEMAERKAAEVVITGHTDTMGSSTNNDRLSLERAKAVEAQLKDTFVAHGVQSDSITTVGRGERDLLVKTRNQVAEPRNRRVEITVR
jgi:outer membrane protein OmpA-like peptidoglycan-associated protein